MNKKEMQDRIDQFRILASVFVILFLIAIIAFIVVVEQRDEARQKYTEEDNYLNNKYLFCEYYGGVYSWHGTDECAFGEYPNDIYPDIRIKNNKWQFKNPEEVLEHFALAVTDENGDKNQNEN